jgi:hypothetical protein
LSESASALFNSASSEGWKSLYTSIMQLLLPEVFHSARLHVSTAVNDSLCSVRTAERTHDCTLLHGVDARKVELAVRVARVHDHAPVLGEPDNQLPISEGEVPGEGVIQNGLSRDEETEGVFPRGSGFDVATADLASSD